VLASDAVYAGPRPITVPVLSPTNYLSVRGVSLHSFTREGSPTIAYCPTLPLHRDRVGNGLPTDGESVRSKRATLALRVQFRYNPCLTSAYSSHGRMMRRAWKGSIQH